MTEDTIPDARRTAPVTAEKLLDEVRQLLQELHPSRAGSVNVLLDSTLDRDLGFDSLSRVELLRRIERAFAVSLPEYTLANAETARDLLRVALSASPAPHPGKPVIPRSAALQETEGAPQAAETLLDVLDWHVLRHAQRPHIYLYGNGDTPEEISYAALLDGARAIAAGLQGWSLQTGENVAIMLPTGRAYLYAFYGILLAGAIPVPIYPPARPSQLEDHLRRHARILINAQAVLLITVPEAQGLARLFKAQVESLRAIVTAEEFAAPATAFNAPVLRANDTAFLQYTSGSTGQPKGVILTHANLLANIRTMGEFIHADSTDVFVSWLPLYHDMGLIGAWLGSLYYAMPLVLMSPLAFLTRPQRWLWAIDKHGGSVSAAPNFAYELCLSKLDDRDLEGLDLSSWRLALNGAEPISPNTIRRFSERFARYRFQAESMTPVYGLAEVAVGLAFPPIGRGPRIDRIQRQQFLASGKAVIAQQADVQALEFVACGLPLPGYEIRIVDPAGREIQERQEGRLEFRGPSVTSGYLRNPEASKKLFDGDWLDSGDLAYIAGGEVYLTSRVKDVIIRAGRNIYPYEVEEAVGNIPAIRKGCVTVFGSTDTKTATERVIVVAETRETTAETLATLRARVHEVATDVLGMPPEDVLLAPPNSVLKTSSGKLRRVSMRELYEKGQISQRPRSVWWQVVRVALLSLRPQLRSARRRCSAIAFAGYAQFVFWLLIPPLWLLIALLPSPGWCRAVTRRSARLLLWLTCTPLRVEGVENLQRRQACVLISNHASYMDSVALVAALPPVFGFVAKAELRRQFFASVFLQRIDTQYVERFDQQLGVADAQRAVEAVRAGHSLLFYPEGTLTRMPGLLPFHMGAFVAAAEAGVAIVPVTVRGTRSILRAGSWFPHRGGVVVMVGAPIAPDGTSWAAAIRLRDAARAAVLMHLGEPDLAHQSPAP